MSLSVNAILKEVEQLAPQEQLQIANHLINKWQKQPVFTAQTKLSRQELFDCLRGQIAIADDFNEPLSDFSEYINF
ncbi:MAG: hypothetical protein ACRC6M_05780 [Microcystaceae cyanobacterium]